MPSRLRRLLEALRVEPEAPRPVSGSSYFRVYAVGICCASVCTALSDEEAAARLDAEHPTGLTNGWFVSNDERFSGGEPNPCPCPDDTRCRHILFNC